MPNAPVCTNFTRKANWQTATAPGNTQPRNKNAPPLNFTKVITGVRCACTR